MHCDCQELIDNSKLNELLIVKSFEKLNYKEKSFQSFKGKNST
jgi:hypothetical protein